MPEVKDLAVLDFDPRLQLVRLAEEISPVHRVDVVDAIGRRGVVMGNAERERKLRQPFDRLRRDPRDRRDGGLDPHSCPFRDVAGLQSSLCPSRRAYKIRELRDRRLTGEVLADIDRRAPVDEVLPLQERDFLARAEGDYHIRIERGERGVRELRVRPADHRQLPRAREVKIESVQRVTERRRRLRQ